MKDLQKPSRKEILWRQYSQHTELYKFYLSLIIKVNIFFYGITGAILSYYFTHINQGYICLSLILPILLSFIFAFIFIYGAILMKYPREEMFKIRDKLKLYTAPDFNVLTTFLWLFGLLLICIGLAILVLLVIL